MQVRYCSQISTANCASRLMYCLVRCSKGGVCGNLNGVSDGAKLTAGFRLKHYTAVIGSPLATIPSCAFSTASG